MPLGRTEQAVPYATEAGTRLLWPGRWRSYFLLMAGVGLDAALVRVVNPD